MAVPDLIFRQKHLTAEHAMNAHTMLADFLKIVTPKSFNKHLLNSLTASLQSLLTNGQCSVTAIGRGIESLAQEKHCIKRADRLLSHTTMQHGAPLFYAAMTGALVKGKQPLILVGWSNADKERRHFILRASLAVEGRAMTLLQMITTESDYTCPHLHKAFLTRLQVMLPKRCRPVIVTDAGFKVPWFKEVSALGWHFIGRVRGKVSVRLPSQSEFISVAKVYKKARQQPMVLGEIALGQSQEYACRAVLAGKGWKLRKQDKNRLYKEPWLLVSNLGYCFNYAKKINKLYAARMQIEEAFRDQKSQTYGLGSNAHRTRNKSRLEVLLLLAALANWLHYMLGVAAELAGKHRSFQANSLKTRRVLSINYLGKRLCRLARVGISGEEIQAAVRQLFEWVSVFDWSNVRKVIA